MTEFATYKKQETVLILLNLAVIAALFLVHIGFISLLGRPTNALLLVLALLAGQVSGTPVEQGTTILSNAAYLQPDFDAGMAVLGKDGQVITHAGNPVSIGRHPRKRQLAVLVPGNRYHSGR